MSEVEDLLVRVGVTADQQPPVRLDHGAVVVDDGGVILSFDAGAEALFGRRAADAIGRSVDILACDGDRQAHPWTYDFLWSWVFTIAGGTSEILREITADESEFQAEARELLGGGG